MDKASAADEYGFVRSSLIFAAAFVILASCDGEDPPEERDAGTVERDSGERDAGSEDIGGGFPDATPIVCDVTAPNACPDPAVRYVDIQPIIQERCLSCHDGSGDEWPLSTYEHAADWYDEIRSMMLACTMPPPAANIPMTTAEREQILLWIRCGFPP